MLLFLDVCMVGKKAVSSTYSVLVKTLRVLRRGHSQLWRQCEQRAAGCRDSKNTAPGRDRRLCAAEGACHSWEGEVF